MHFRIKHGNIVKRFVQLAFLTSLILLCWITASATPMTKSPGGKSHSSSGASSALGVVGQCQITPVVESFGIGAAGQFGTPQLKLSALPLLNVFTLKLQISGGVPFAKAELLVSENDNSFGGFNLGPQPWKNMSFSLDALGEATLPTSNLALDNPALCGKLFVIQVGLEDPAAPGGIAITNAVRVTFGSTAQFAPTVDPVTSPTADSTATISGHGTQPGNKIVVEGGIATVETLLQSDGTFAATVALSPNSLNKLFVYEVGGDGSKGTPATATIMHDNEAPVFSIDFPAEGAALTGTTFEVGGKVGDELSGTSGMKVFVDGAPALVNPGIGINGNYFLSGIPLNQNSPTSIEIVAQDILGNGRSKVLTVQKLQPPAGFATIEVVSGNNQSAKVEATLPTPLKVRLKKADGTPLADKVVTFAVVKSDGKLSDGSTPGVMTYQVMSDTNGFAQAFWTLGKDAGQGNNRVNVLAAGVLGTATFFASTTANPAARIVSSSGMNQQAALGAPLPNPLRVWVSDKINSISNIPVTFKVVEGDGHFSGETQVTVSTDVTGHAEVPFTIGATSSINTVEATFTGNTGLPAAFVATAVRSVPTQKTSLTTIVQSNGGQPLVGARSTLKIGDTLLGPVFSNAQGIIHFADIPESGPALLDVNGATVTHVGVNPGTDVPVGSYPALNFSIVLVEHADNTLPTPVIFPPLDPANAVLFDNTKDIDLTVKSLPGFKMHVKKGSVYRKDGLPPSVQDPVILSLDQVQVDDIPLLMPDGIASPFAWTLQPYGLYFSPPISIEVPNMSALEPGTSVYFTSFNHDTSSFEVAGVGGVSSDGSMIRTDPGTGVEYSGWGGVNAQPPPSGGVKGDCTRQDNGCGSGATNFLVPEKVLFGLCDFSSGCGNHDICWGTCGNQKLACNINFFGDLLFACTQCKSSLAIPTCMLVAGMYYKAVSLPLGFYCGAQEENCSCKEQPNPAACSFPLTSTANLTQGVGEEPTVLDDDNDFMEDNWELSVGLNPADPNDGQKDPDNDALPNYLEFFHMADPFDADTDNDGIDDGAQAIAAQLPLPLGIDESWDLSVAGLHVQPTEFGTFNFPSIVVQDVIGANGQASAPDGVSDVEYRVTGVSTKYGTTRYMRSGCFNIIAGQSVRAGNFEYSYTPFTELDSISLSVATETLTQIDQQVTLHVGGSFSDGSSRILGPDDVCNTVYLSSNPAIASIDTNGVITAHAAGFVFISVRAEGATSTIGILVAPGSVLTTLQGFVVTPSGTPVAGAVIKTSANLNATSAANGSFTVNAHPANGGLITASAEATISGNKVIGASFKKAPLPGGITDMGLIVVDADTDADGLNNWYETNVSGTSPSDSDSDDDGISDSLEVLQYETNPNNSDTDGDGILDGVEILLGLNPLVSDFTSTLQGHLTLPDGGAAVGAKVRVAGAAVNFYKTTTDSSGAFSISGWPASLPVSITAIHVAQNKTFSAVAGPLTPVIGVTDFGTVPLVQTVFNKPLFAGTQASMTSGASPAAVVIADFNEDQIPDIATANAGSKSLGIALGNGGGSFQPAIAILSAGAEPRDLVAEDFNGDGHTDIVLVNKTGDLAKFYPGLGNGQFGTTTDIIVSVRGNVLGIKVLDVDHDLKKDLVIVSSSGKLATILNNGAGTFTPTITTPDFAGTAPFSFTTADATGDGVIDIIVASFLAGPGGRICILPGLPAGGFGSTIVLGPEVGVTSTGDVRIGDFNADSIPDLAIVNAQQLRILLGQGSGAFGSATLVPGMTDLRSIAVGRLNGDTKDDIVGVKSSGLHNAINSTVMVFGKGDGTFEPVITFAVGSFTNGVLIAEADGDAFIDIVTVASMGVVTIARGNGTDKFLGTEQEFMPTTPAPQVQSTLGDMNQDGIEDIITFDGILSTDAGIPVTYLGKADGTFQQGVTSAFNFQDYRIANLNNDSIPDMVGASLVSSQLVIQAGLGQTNGTFVATGPAVVLTGNYGPPLTVPLPVDFDGDGNQDLLILSTSSGLTLLRGQGTGMFFPAVTIPFTAGGVLHQAVDVNKDGKRDILFSVNTGGFNGLATLHVAYGAGDFTFTPAKSFAPSVPSIMGTALSVEDLDLDGNLDILFSAAQSPVFFGPAQALIYYGKANGDFESSLSVPLSPITLANNLLIVDINNDQLPDILGTVNDVGGGASIVLNRGDRTFFSPWVYRASGDSTLPLVTDRNGDGRLDLISVARGGGSTSIQGFSIMKQLQ
jgi:hypothetical protein